MALIDQLMQSLGQSVNGIKAPDMQAPTTQNWLDNVPNGVKKPSYQATMQDETVPDDNKTSLLDTLTKTLTGPSDSQNMAYGADNSTPPATQTITGGMPSPKQMKPEEYFANPQAMAGDTKVPEKDDTIPMDNPQPSSPAVTTPPPVKTQATPHTDYLGGIMNALKYGMANSGLANDFDTVTKLGGAIAGQPNFSIYNNQNNQTQGQGASSADPYAQLIQTKEALMQRYLQLTSSNPQNAAKYGPFVKQTQDEIKQLRDNEASWKVNQGEVGVAGPTEMKNISDTGMQVERGKEKLADLASAVVYGTGGKDKTGKPNVAPGNAQAIMQKAESLLTDASLQEGLRRTDAGQAALADLEAGAHSTPGFGWMDAKGNIIPAKIQATLSNANNALGILGNNYDSLMRQNKVTDPDEQKRFNKYYGKKADAVPVNGPDGQPIAGETYEGVYNKMMQGKDYNGNDLWGPEGAASTSALKMATSGAYQEGQEAAAETAGKGLGYVHEVGKGLGIGNTPNKYHYSDQAYQNALKAHASGHDTEITKAAIAERKGK